jgi:predicted nucleotidyltransferase
VDYLDILRSTEYDFLRTTPKLGDNIMFVTLGGSHAYGTNVEGSDLDIRGCAFNTKEELLLQNCFEQIIDNNTDTTIYGFNKFIKLLSNCNPNVIEMLGLPKEYYWQLSDLGAELIDKRDMFLSKKAVQTFGGYAYAQLRRLDNKAVRTTSQEAYEEHILHSIENAKNTFPEKYFKYDDEMIKLYLDDSTTPEFDKEIFIDTTLKHYPLRDYLGMWSEMKEIAKEYSKNKSKRNEHAASHGKLGKHMMHLIRLYLMCIDILRDGQIITRRDKEHDLLMSIRNGKYLDDDNQPTKEFFEMVEYYQNEMRKAEEHSPLPLKPDFKAIQDFQMKVNESVINVPQVIPRHIICSDCGSLATYDPYFKAYHCSKCGNLIYS